MPPPDPAAPPGPSGRRGQWQPHQATVRLLGVALLVLSLLVWWRGMPGSDGDKADDTACAAPVSAQVADWSTSSTLVVRARFDGVVSLSDGTTDVSGWQVMVRSTSPAEGGALDPGAAQAPAAGSVVLVWPGPAEGTPGKGDSLLLWVREHEGTTVDGQPAPGFDLAGALAVSGTSGQRLCPGVRSRAVPLSQLTPAPAGGR